MFERDPIGIEQAASHNHGCNEWSAALKTHSIHRILKHTIKIS